MDIIFDVDGTLLNIEHRVPLIRPTNGGKKDWAAFRNAAHRDQPNHEIFQIMDAMLDARHRVIICTGRMERERDITHSRLAAYSHTPRCWELLMMRADNDCREDYIVKQEMLKALRAQGFDPVLAFDDRQQVVDMWREQGLRVCQVAKGDF